MIVTTVRYSWKGSIVSYKLITRGGSTLCEKEPSSVGHHQMHLVI